MTTIADSVERVDPETLIPYTNNPKEHPEEQVKKIASSIKNYGWDQPIVVDSEGEVIKGHGRLQAAEKLGLDEVPVIWREDLSDAEAKAARIADNKTAESPWNDDLLATELDVLDDFENIELGFDEGEVDDLLDDVASESIEELSEPPLEDKALEDVRILNLYAGIGGNRKLWGDEPDVTAVEYNEQIADAYKEFHPDDSVAVEDAHDYLENNYADFDIVWTSPPCPTHSKLKPAQVAASKSGNTGAFEYEKDAVYPDMDLYAEIIFLDTYFDGKYIVENVVPYYDPLIEPSIILDRHAFWTNFDIGSIDEQYENSSFNVKETEFNARDHAERYGFDYDVVPNPDGYPRNKILRNCVDPKLGKHILESAINDDL